MVCHFGIVRQIVKQRIIVIALCHFGTQKPSKNLLHSANLAHEKALYYANLALPKFPKVSPAGGERTGTIRGSYLSALAMFQARRTVVA